MENRFRQKSQQKGKKNKKKSSPRKLSKEEAKIKLMYQNALLSPSVSLLRPIKIKSGSFKFSKNGSKFFFFTETHFVEFDVLGGKVLSKTLVVPIFHPKTVEKFFLGAESKQVFVDIGRSYNDYLDSNESSGGEEGPFRVKSGPKRCQIVEYNDGFSEEFGLRTGQDH